jgi:4-hydroxy-2-oxoheptanedioate aldolase
VSARTDQGFRARIGAGELLVGAWSVIPSAVTAEILAQGGLDFIIVDFEHGPHDFATAQSMAAAAQLHGCAPLVRVPTNADWMILRALEIGAAGVVVPQVTSVEVARAAVSAAKYFPLGTRGASPFTRAGGFQPENPAATFTAANAETVVVLLVEGLEGIRAIEDIAAVDGVDVVYIGTYDLSQAAGHPGQPNHPDVAAFTAECLTKIRAAGKCAGILVETDAELARAAKLGFRFLPYVADAALLMRAVRHVVAHKQTLETGS